MQSRFFPSLLSSVPSSVVSPGCNRVVFRSYCFYYSVSLRPLLLCQGQSLAAGQELHYLNQNFSIDIKVVLLEIYYRRYCLNVGQNFN